MHTLSLRSPPIRRSTVKLAATGRLEQHIQIRHLPWVPIAYRKGNPRSAAPGNRGVPQGSRTGRPSKGRVGRNNVAPAGASRRPPWKQQKMIVGDNQHGIASDGDSSENASSSKKEASTRTMVESTKQFSRLVIQMNRDLAEYGDLLGGRATEKQPTPSQGSTNQNNFNSLISLLSSVHSGGSPMTWDSIIASEQRYKEICRQLGEAIALTSKIHVLAVENNSQKTGDTGSSADSSQAEHLLLAFIEFQSERAKLAEAARKSSSPEIASTAKSVLGWITSKVFHPLGNPETPTSTDKDTSQMAHEDPTCGPKLEHFHLVTNAVLATMREEPNNSDQSPFRRIRRAQRLQHVLERMPNNVSKQDRAIRDVLHAYALVGSYESARLAERVAEDAGNEDLIASVLHAYFMAAKNSPRDNDRHKAALRAEEIFHQKWGSNNGPEHFDEQKFAQCTEVLKCLQSVGLDDTHDICAKADSLVGVCIGKYQFDEIFRNANLTGLWKIAPAHHVLLLLNTLVYVYASSREPTRINSAKQLLNAMLNDTELNHDQEVPFPNINTCKAVLSAMERNYGKGTRAHGNDSFVPNPNLQALAKDAAQEDIDFGIKLLDQMCTRPCCWPDHGCFHSLFRLLLLSRPTNAGAVAEELLSKMHIRECFRNGPTVTRKIYDLVLRAWLVSAEGGDPYAARRALGVIDSMIAQSLPLLRRPVTGENNFSAYKLSVSPDRSTYHLLLAICSAIKVPGEKEGALDIALAVKEKMTKQSIAPTADTFSLLFTCCDKLLSEHSERREAVTLELLEAARNQGTLNEEFLGRLKTEKSLELDEDKHSTFPKKPEPGFGLLSDLK